MGFNPFDIFNPFGGGGGGNAGADSMNQFLTWRRQQEERLKLEGAEYEEFRKTITSFRRNMLADRPGFSGLVNVGTAVKDSDARLAARMAKLAPDDPDRVRYDKAQAAELVDFRKSRMTISGEEFKVRERVRDIAKGVDDDLTFDPSHETRLQDLIDQLTAIRKERSGRYAGREDISKGLTAAREKLEEWRLMDKRARRGPRRPSVRDRFRGGFSGNDAGGGDGTSGSGIGPGGATGAGAAGATGAY